MLRNFLALVTKSPNQPKLEAKIGVSHFLICFLINPSLFSLFVFLSAVCGTNDVCSFVRRALLTEKLTSLGPGNPRLADSEEDIASDDLQTDDDLEGGEEEERREEYAITFDLPGE